MTDQFRDNRGFPVPVFIEGAVHKVAYTTSSGTTSTTISEKCKLVRIWCSTDAHVVAGPAADADTDDSPISGGVDRLMRVKAGDKLSAIQQTNAGTLYATELL